MEEMNMFQWLCKSIFEDYFDSDKRRLAFELRVSERTLDLVFRSQHAAESELLFEQIVRYCARNNISIDEILSRYPHEGE